MNKLLVRVYIPIIEDNFDIYIPINKKIGTIKNIIISSISELSSCNLSSLTLELYDRKTGAIFNNNAYVKESSIKNGTNLLLF